MAMQRTRRAMVTVEWRANDAVRIFAKEACEVFEEITTLPPARASDHQIPLLPKTGPVAVRTYRYPYYQKLELEKQIREMLNTGIID